MSTHFKIVSKEKKKDFKKRQLAFLLHYQLPYIFVYCRCKYTFDADKKQSILYTGCPRRNVKYFGRVFLELNYTDITQNTYIQS